MRRYVVKITCTSRIIDETDSLVGYFSDDREVAVDIKGKERDRIIADVTNGLAQDIASDATNCFKTVEKEQQG